MKKVVKEQRNRIREKLNIKHSFFLRKCKNCNGLGILNPVGEEGWSYCKECKGTGLNMTNIIINLKEGYIIKKV